MYILCWTFDGNFTCTCSHTGYMYMCRYMCMVHWRANCSCMYIYWYMYMYIIMYMLMFLLVVGRKLMMTRRLSSGWFYCTGIVGLVKSPNGCRDGGGGDRLDDYDDVKAATTHAMQQLTGICSIRHLLSVFDKRMTMIACCHFGSLSSSELHLHVHVHVQCSLTFFFTCRCVSRRIADDVTPGGGASLRQANGGLRSNQRRL